MFVDVPLPHGIKFKTSGSLVAMEAWLEANCLGRWSLVLTDVDDAIEQKEVQLRFANKDEKDRFVNHYGRRKS